MLNKQTPNKIKALSRITALVAILCLQLAGMRAYASGGGEEGKFKAGEMIVHHISDAHSVHFFGHVT